LKGEVVVCRKEEGMRVFHSEFVATKDHISAAPEEDCSQRVGRRRGSGNEQEDGYGAK